MIDLRNNDCLQVLKDIPDKSIDLVVTDCPYKKVSGGCSTGIYGSNPGGIFNKVKEEDLVKTRSGYRKANSKHISLFGCLNDMADDVRKGKMFKYNDIEFKEWLPDIYRILKDNTHCYIMINARNLKDLQIAAEEVGFKFQNLLIWMKNNATPNKYYLNQHECILMLRKGKAKNINNMGTKNILQVNNIIGNKKHPTEKPVELMKILIENSTNEGDTVIDPFMGVGATGVACKNLKRNFVGIEIDGQYYEIAKKRINEVEQETTIFDFI